MFYFNYLFAIEKWWVYSMNCSYEPERQLMLHVCLISKTKNN